MTGLSKYFIAVFVIFYTFHCFAVFSYKNDEDRRVFYVFQNILMVLMHMLGFYVLYARSGNPELPVLCILEEIVFFAMISLFKHFYPSASRLITNNICMLLAIGFVMLARLSESRARKQFIIAAVSVVIALLVPFFIKRIRLIRRHYWIAGAGGLAVLLLMTTIGTVTNGSRISLTIAGVTFLPSEFVRLLFIFFLAGIFTDKEQTNPETGRPGIQSVVSSGVIAAAYIGTLAVCKDLGSALMFFVIYFFMLYTATKAPIVLIGGFGGMALASLTGYGLFSHVRNRVRAWLDPFNDVEGAGYQAAQSLFAIGTGSWFGLGLMGGSPKSIPEVAKDFIFAAISEEMGGLVALCVILISLSNFLMFMNISMSINQAYLRLMAVGLAVNYGFQVILTIGGVTKFIPMTGITLPLVSYGGSSVIVTFICFSIIQGLYVLSRDETESGTYFEDDPRDLYEEDYEYDGAEKQGGSKSNRRYLKADDTYYDREDDYYNDGRYEEGYGDDREARKTGGKQRTVRKRRSGSSGAGHIKQYNHRGSQRSR
ncbi:MAG: FtsW/RodA/SpoVE family cell cycle protein [Lachnospiraceae bacterium]|nr:FtsW/RodA/SpoVE family cell cycle protein [Lachnospiraceae bacterium]